MAVDSVCFRAQVVIIRQGRQTQGFSWSLGPSSSAPVSRSARLSLDGAIIIDYLIISRTGLGWHSWKCHGARDKLGSEPTTS